MPNTTIREVDECDEFALYLEHYSKQNEREAWWLNLAYALAVGLVIGCLMLGGRGL